MRGCTQSTYQATSQVISTQQMLALTILVTTSGTWSHCEGNTKSPITRKGKGRTKVPLLSQVFCLWPPLVPQLSLLTSLPAVLTIMFVIPAGELENNLKKIPSRNARYAIHLLSNSFSLKGSQWAWAPYSPGLRSWASKSNRFTSLGSLSLASWTQMTSVPAGVVTEK